MSLAVNPRFIDKIKKLGAFDINACYSCGNCTAICPLSDGENSFPRKMIRYTLLGLDRKILSSPELWLCYYCGECSDSCPREADPGGLMMALRRFAIRSYSLGKVADLLYRGTGSILLWIFLTLAAALGIYFFHKPNPALDKVNPLTFISLDFLHTAGLVLGAFIFFFAMVQIFIMARSISKGKKPAGPWLKPLWEALWNEVLLQKRFSDCEDKTRRLPHLGLFWGFSLLFIATILAFGQDFRFFPGWAKIPARILGLLGAVFLLYGSGYFLLKRFSRQDAYSKYSHHSDWIFLLLFFLLGFTGLLMDLFHLLSMPWATYITFAIHLVLAFDLIVTAPFSKFAHSLYRPIALWISQVYKK